MTVVCPDCDTVCHIELTHAVTRTSSGLSVIVRPTGPVEHSCDDIDEEDVA